MNISIIRVEGISISENFIYNGQFTANGSLYQLTDFHSRDKDLVMINDFCSVDYDDSIELLFFQSEEQYNQFQMDVVFASASYEKHKKLKLNKLQELLSNTEEELNEELFLHCLEQKIDRVRG